MLSPQSTQVAIIGAGPSGSIAAALLKQHNIDCIVLEKSTFPRFSIGESLLPACMESIKKAGMLEAVEKANFQYKDGAAFHFDGTFTSFDFTEKFSPGAGTTYQVQRGNFDKVLADSAQEQGVEIRYQHEITDVNVSQAKALLSVLDADGNPYQVEADFVLDASGFGRVLPKILELEEPSCLPPRKAIFTHITDNITDINYDRNKILISVHPTNTQVWYWLIPFSNGTCSFGVVGEPEFFEHYSQDNIEALKQLATEDRNLQQLLAHAKYSNPSGEIMGYSANVTTLCERNFALLGNAGEFLDPVFSSGVTIAMKSAELAAELLIKQFNQEEVNWHIDYSDKLMKGVNTFRCYVEGWYEGTFQDVIFHEDSNPKIKQMISAILAGYAWDEENPFVAEPERRLKVIAELCKP
ncbi:NAD(P)/FAD-dependent oxidoreductase [Aliivibrio finisterrensis]|uniref:NAD(P)/FAD-dependent oxidoreductase n=1 Tax=Aliivibrio finisterrensis TaxID=511998 RepID=A0A4Q5KN79_9GAMM|nr:MULTISPECIES: NAD(P)/FAD-dependent oxidoreductase [Aliivibrio]MDD9173318.1 NAD(P)/FAD-dependent oxidoreductase [Aliivibrio sp. S3TY1]MDD9190394.1 NAD(P)/FAD-dependent oxidoreductase [Aliivibrio sp. S2TY2]RYU47203.1 NAD(P)/FAD-dependent oxidoreductase [Aliivibrio finisterrensis]